MKNFIRAFFGPKDHHNNKNKLSEIEIQLKNLNEKLITLQLDQSMLMNEQKIIYESLSSTVQNLNMESMHNRYFEQIESLLRLYSLMPGLKFLPPTRGWAGSPDFLSKIAEVIIKEKPKFVLELSCGVSTVIISKALQLNGFGSSISIEHQLNYGKITESYLVINQTEDISSIMYAPLSKIIIDDNDFNWFDIGEPAFPDKIDLLIVDGPPGSTNYMARFPAVPVLSKYFSDRTIILLDDANRKDEKMIIEKWYELLISQNFTINISTLPNLEKGLSIIEAIRK